MINRINDFEEMEDLDEYTWRQDEDDMIISKVHDLAKFQRNNDKWSM